MNRKSKIIIIPAYNEEDNISNVIRDIISIQQDIDILVVDDGSDDNTCKAARSTGAEVIRLPFNMGYGAALQTGFKYAIKNDYDYAVQIDGDGQHDPKFIPSLLNAVETGDTDVAIGSRYLKGGYRSTLPRMIGILIFGTIASLIIRQKVTDPTSGFQALNKESIRFYASEYYPVDYPDADVIIMLHRAGFRIKELPVVMHEKVYNKKTMHSGIKPLYYIFKMLLSISVTLLRKIPYKR
ncbi:MAG: glycosyltransferase family 2 protein [Nitrospirota bacterium]